MKKIFFVLICVIALGRGSFARLDAQTKAPQAFAPLIGGCWQAEGEWSNGMKFEQKVEFKWALGRTIVVAESYGVIDPKSGKRGHRNHGVRAWNEAENKLWFWEFDVFGGLTQGEVTTDGANLTLIYEYGEGEKRVKLRDRWTRVDDRTYDFTVEQFENGAWSRKLLATQFRRTETSE